MSGVPARRAAADLLIEILENRRMMEEALASVQSYNQLQGPDRGFARAMASAVLRQLGRIDLGVGPFLNRPLKDATPEVRALLRLGAAQAWILGTPAHAAVGETVNTAKQMPGAKGASGFLNAVLRKVASDRTLFDAAPPEAIWPAWLKDLFIESLGADGMRALARAQSEEPLLHLTAKSGDAGALAAQTGGTEIGPASAALSTGSVESITGYETGDWWVQDLAAALPAQLLRVNESDYVIDLCAAPGGKTMQLASTGARITAIDRSKKRLQRVHDNLARTGLTDRTEIIAANAETWRPKELADAVLLDAPCSALGTLRRHPEGAWIKDPGAIARFPDIQTRLLMSASEMVKPGGQIIYCVCTPLQREGEHVIDAVTSKNILHRVPITRNMAGQFQHAITQKGDLLTVSSSAPLHDAFFMSVLQRA